MRILCGTFLKLLMLRQKRIGMVARSPDESWGGQIAHTLDVLVYVEKCAEESEAFGRKVAQQRRSRPQGPAAQGRKNRPYQKESAVGRKNDAHWQGTNGNIRCKKNTARQSAHSTKRDYVVKNAALLFRADFGKIESVFLLRIGMRLNRCAV